MFYTDTQSFLNFLRILNRLEVGVFARAVKLESPCTSLYLISNFFDVRVHIIGIGINRGRIYFSLEHEHLRNKY
jgi:hypothetical protein